MKMHMFDNKQLFNLKLEYILKGMHLVKEFEQLSDEEQDQLLADFDMKLNWIKYQLGLEDGK